MKQASPMGWSRRISWMLGPVVAMSCAANAQTSPLPPRLVEPSPPHYGWGPCQPNGRGGGQNCGPSPHHANGQQTLWPGAVVPYTPNGRSATIQPPYLQPSYRQQPCQPVYTGGISNCGSFGTVNSPVISAPHPAPTWQGSLTKSPPWNSCQSFTDAMGRRITRCVRIENPGAQF